MNNVKEKSKSRNIVYYGSRSLGFTYRGHEFSFTFESDGVCRKMHYDLFDDEGNNVSMELFNALAAQEGSKTYEDLYLSSYWPPDIMTILEAIDIYLKNKYKE